MFGSAFGGVLYNFTDNNLHDLAQGVADSAGFYSGQTPRSLPASGLHSSKSASNDRADRADVVRSRECRAGQHLPPLPDDGEAGPDHQRQRHLPRAPSLSPLSPVSLPATRGPRVDCPCPCHCHRLATWTRPSTPGLPATTRRRLCLLTTHAARTIWRAVGRLRTTHSTPSTCACLLGAGDRTSFAATRSATAL